MKLRTVTIGMLGCGNIGCGVWKLLHEFERELVHRQDIAFNVKKILVRDIEKHRMQDIPLDRFTVSVQDVTDDPEIELIVECMGGQQPATEYMQRALRNGKTVVTANKMAVALQWHSLQNAAMAGGAGLYFEAAVGGAMPIIRMLNESLQANRVDSIKAIINGTTNYILSRMTDEGLSYETVLQDAQRLGFAEPDPTSDVEGEDATYKLSILASLAFHARIPVRYVSREGITGIKRLDIEGARELGYTIKLLAVAKRDGNTVDVRVQPVLVPLHHPLAAVSGPFNAVYLHGHACGDMMIYGRGAGSAPTASAIVSDILCAVEQKTPQYPTFDNEQDELSPLLRVAKDRCCAFYLRLSAKDTPGVLSHVTGCLSQAGVSVRAILQPESKQAGKAQITLLTHPAFEKDVRKAISVFDPALVATENVLRVEE